MGKFAVRDIRNIALVGHGAVGKTTLADALLHFAKAVERRGSPDDGSSVFDFDDEEKSHHYSIDSAIGHLDYQGNRFHILDAPGYPDFLSQAIGSLNAVETAIIVIDAHRGIEANTRRMFDEAGKAGIARMFLINKLDADNIDFPQLIQNIQTTFGKECVLFQTPIGIGPKLTGVIRALHHEGSAPPGAIVDPQKLHDELVERIVETDDDLLAAFLEGEIPNMEQLDETLTKAIASQKIFPILCASGKKDIGLAEFLDSLVEFAPSPCNGPIRKATIGDLEIVIEPDPDKPFVGQVFKTHADKFGNLTYMRVFQGHLNSNVTEVDDRSHGSHRLGQLNIAQGKTLEKVDEVGPGEYVVVAKVDGVNINDTLSADGSIHLPPAVYPKPMFPLAVSAKARGDDAKVVLALRKIAHEDPCFEVHRDEQTLETIMQGMSQLHLEIIQSRLKHRDHLELETHVPKVPYKETIAREGEGMFRHKKQTGGRGQFAEVHLRLRPREPGEGFLFTNSVVGGSIPGQYIPAVEKGIREVMQKGILAGAEIVDLEAEVHFGKYHDVDSSEQAFKYAASMAFREAFMQCQPMLLEPIVDLEVAAPIDKMGEINGDLNTRRAHITGMDVLPGGMQSVRAEAPLAEVMRYQTELKSMTGGQGSFNIEFSHLAPLPPNVQQQVVDRFQKNRKETVEV